MLSVTYAECHLCWVSLMLSATFKQLRLSDVMLRVVAPFDVPLMPDLYFQLYSGQSKNTLVKINQMKAFNFVFIEFSSINSFIRFIRPLL